MTRLKTRGWALLVGALALMLVLQGCGGDDNGLSTEDMARISAAEDAAAMAQAEAAAAKMEAEAAHEEAEQAIADAAAATEEAEQAKMDAAAATEEAEAAAAAEAPTVDTSATDAAIEALETLVQQLDDRTATPATAMEILGGEKSTASANDRAALAKKIAMQLNTTFDHDVDAAGLLDPDKSLLNLPDIDGSPSTTNELTRVIAHALGTRIVSEDGTSDDGDFLKHTFADGTMVDLTSPGDIETLSVGNLLKVNGVDLKSFTLEETDKMMTESGEFNPVTAVLSMAPATPDTHTMTTTLGKDGSRSVVVKDVTGDTVFSDIITYVGGARVVEYDMARTAPIDADANQTPPARVVVMDDRAANAAGMVTRKNGDTLTVLRGTLEGTPPAFAAGVEVTDTIYDYDPTNPTWVTGGPSPMLPAASQATAKAAYDNAGAAYTIAQHNAKGYGAWLTDSFFVAYVMNAEDDAIISDPDDTVMKVAWGSRSPDNDAVFGRLSGRGETAHWKGLMVGHDMDADADTYKMMLKGNAMITARVGAATLADNQAQNVPDIVDVMLSNIITADGTRVSRVADGIEWTNLDLNNGYFQKGSEIAGRFFANGDEVVGDFNKSNILGVFGAKEYEMMDAMMDMASGN